jgi:hypothetical protein
LEEEIFYRETGRIRGSVEERVVKKEKVELDVGAFTLARNIETIMCVEGV